MWNGGIVVLDRANGGVAVGRSRLCSASVIRLFCDCYYLFSHLLFPRDSEHAWLTAAEGPRRMPLPIRGLEKIAKIEQTNYWNSESRCMINDLQNRESSHNCATRPLKPRASRTLLTPLTLVLWRAAPAAPATSARSRP
jgi:hypothetical protein